MTDKPERPDESEDPADMAFAAQLAGQLRHHESQLDDPVAEQLYEARMRAVDAARVGPPASRRWLMPVMGVGMTAAAAILVVVLLLPVASPMQPLPLGEDMEIAAAQDLELLEDLEFVAWMVALEDSQGLNNSG